MKPFFSLLLLLTTAVFSAEAQKYEYKIITSVESIVPMGLGRSRIISVYDNRNYKYFTVVRSDSE